jgi:hypothetical protein
VYWVGASVNPNPLSDGILKALPSLCRRKIIELHSRKNGCCLTDLILPTVGLRWCPLVYFPLRRWLRDGHGIQQTIVLHINHSLCSRGWERAMHKIDFNVVWSNCWGKISLSLPQHRKPTHHPIPNPNIPKSSVQRPDRVLKPAPPIMWRPWGRHQFEKNRTVVWQLSIECTPIIFEMPYIRHQTAENRWSVPLLELHISDLPLWTFLKTIKNHSKTMTYKEELRSWGHDLRVHW